MAGETTVVSPWPQQIFHEDGTSRRGESDNLKTRTFAVSQQVAEGFAGERVKDAHIDVIKEQNLTRKEISDLRYAVYSLSEKVTAQSAETKMLLLQQENERLRDRLLRRHADAV